MAKSRTTGREALDEARKLLMTLKGQQGVVKKVLGLLRVVEGEIQRNVVSIEPVRRGKTPLRYVVESTALGETLAEHRLEGSSPPFRCPKPVWDAVIEVLAKAEEPLSAEEIADGVEQRAGTRPGDHQYRVPLRLLTQIDPPLLIRSRAKYRATEDFSKRASELWNQLES